MQLCDAGLLSTLLEMVRDSDFGEEAEAAKARADGKKVLKAVPEETDTPQQVAPPLHLTHDQAKGCAWMEAMPHAVLKTGGGCCLCVTSESTCCRARDARCRT